MSSLLESQTMKKNILGLDLGITSIGWAHVIEGETPQESAIKQIGSRIIQFDNFDRVDKQGNVTESRDPLQDFASGRGLSPNASRTKNRGARRLLDRYKMRRKNLIDLLLESNIIDHDTILAEDGKNTTHETWRLRSKAATERIELDELARVLLAINKKRGYKSSRKAKSAEEGYAIDSMGIAKKLYEENITPGEYVFENMMKGRKAIPDFYRSDLEAELNKVWDYQRTFYPEILTNEFYEELKGKGIRASSALFWSKYKFNTASIKDLDDSLKNEQTIKYSKRDQRKLQAYKWRSDAISKQIDKEQMAYVIADINSNINSSSGYLGAISDRSKELYFNNETVGQYLYKQLQKNPHTSLKNQVFYRQDYLDEFETIWTTQAKFHPQLTEKLKQEIRDIVIFYQRQLKSQKSLISFCEFQSKEVEIDGKKRTIGSRVAPRSSHLSQEFKIWQNLNNVVLRKSRSKKRLSEVDNLENLIKNEKDKFVLDMESKQLLFDELNLKGRLKDRTIIELLGYKPKDWEINYTELEGNNTNAALYNAYLKILEIEGYNADLLKLSNKDEINVGELKTSAYEIKDMVKSIFKVLGINTKILDFDAELEGKEFEQQASYQFWHLLYSAEDDYKEYSEEDILLYGNESIGLKKQLCAKFGFAPEHAKILANVAFQDDYGSLSTKAMRKIYPYIKESIYSDACKLAGYRHSKHSLTTEEIENRILKSKLDVIKKNSLRNPVVEKILNQMVNVVNALIDKENDKLEREGKPRNFHFDEIRIELARELKKSADERAEMTLNINAAKRAYEDIAKLLQAEFGIKNPTRNDIIRYRLYEELKDNGYKDLYTNTYIPREILFSKQVDIEHIIPQSRMFDDSFSNKTVVYRKDNLKKGNRTAIDYIEDEYGEKGVDEYVMRVRKLFELNGKNGSGITKAKYHKLLRRASEIGDGFIERDLRDSQYIAKKAKEILFQITRRVVSTSGRVTNRLREDWDLINVMKELNLPKYRALGLTEMEERKFGQKIEMIQDWTKRDDHRHHAMDALVVAFTKHAHIQYLNHLNARKNCTHKLHRHIIGIENRETELIDNGNGRRRKFITPIPNFRQVAKEHLESVLISHKAKNKVVTNNINRVKTKQGYKKIIELTPRGQLHKETVYGKIKQPVVKEMRVGGQLTLELVEKVTNPTYKKLLLKRLSEHDNNPRKAFLGNNSLSKSPIYLNDSKTETLPQKVSLMFYEDCFTIRKDVAPDLRVDKVVDAGIRRILQDRLEEYGGNARDAFSDLDKNPIWLNREKGISIKRVTITGVRNAEALHYKKDHFGEFIKNEKGNKIPVDFVSTGNNHHVAIYRDKEGNLQEKVVSFFEAVERARQGMNAIDRDYNKDIGWEFLFTMKQNEMFVFPNKETGFDPNEIDLMDSSNRKDISPNLFRVQSISIVRYGNSTIRDFKFRHHLESTLVDNKALVGTTYFHVKSLAPLTNMIKVRINHLGDIVAVGEY